MNVSEKIILAVRERDVLWNLNNKNYKNVKLKAKEWQAVAEELNLPSDIVKKKWRCLRDNFLRNLAKNRGSDGQGADEDMEMAGKYSRQMQFLRDHLKPRSRTIGNHLQTVKEETDVLMSPKSTVVTNESDKLSSSSTNLSTFPFFDEASCSMPHWIPQQPSTPQPYSITQPHAIEKTFINTMASVQEFLAKPRSPSSIVINTPSPAPSNLEDELFWRSLVEKLSKFPIQLRNDTKLEMLRYINSVEVEWLNKSQK